MGICFITKQIPIQHFIANSTRVRHKRKSRSAYFLSFPFPTQIFAKARQIPIKAPPITQIQNAAPKAFAKISSFCNYSAKVDAQTKIHDTSVLDAYRSSFTFLNPIPNFL